MPDLEHAILSEWFKWLITYHDIKVDLIGKYKYTYIIMQLFPMGANFFP